MINIIVFSKNRAAQLELFIRSFKKYVANADNYTIKVIYLCTDDQYEKGYRKLFEMKYSNVEYIRESNFKQNVIETIDKNKKYTVFFVDDNIFKNPFDFFDEQMEIFNNDKEILCRSLRLHKNISICYPEGKRPINQPVFSDNNTFYWMGEQGDYGYPMSLDGHIFRTEQIYPYVVNLHYTNPNTMEGMWASRPMRQPKMICYDKSIIVNNPCNKVQTVNGNIHGNVNTIDLNNNFLEGKIISMKNIDGIENISCHQEIEIIYI